LRRWIRRAAAAAMAALTLAGCAALPPAGPSDSRRVSVYYETFEASGRMAVNRAGEGFSFNFRWTGTPEADAVDLQTPLGQVVAQLVSERGRVRLTGADGRVIEAGSWEELTQRELGWPLPVAGLRYWIQAVPRPGGPYAESPDAFGRLAHLQQDGWDIFYRYAGDGPAPSRPSSLRLGAYQLEVRIVVDQWN
jgi:outer membrane lipoprotein LolB